TSSTPPDGTVIDCHCGTGAPSSVTLTGAPVTQTRPPSGNRSAGPPLVHSRPAAPSGLPSTRLPIRNDRSSIGPDGGTPTCQYPMRPGQSCRVVSIRGRTTSIAVTERSDPRHPPGEPRSPYAQGSGR